MAGEENWKCTYHPPNAARRPFTPAKLEDITWRVCREYGMYESLTSFFKGLFKCGEPPKAVCSGLRFLAVAAHDVREGIEDYEVLIETVMGILAAGGFLTAKERIILEAALKTLTSAATEDALNDLGEWLNCGDFGTGGGF